MRNVVQLFLAANTILLMHKWNHACSLLVYVTSVITPGRLCALTTFRRYYSLKNKFRDWIIKQLLNSVIAKYQTAWLSISHLFACCVFACHAFIRNALAWKWHLGKLSLAHTTCSLKVISSNRPKKKNLMSKIDYGSSVISISPPKNYLAHRRNKETKNSSNPFSSFLN